MRELNVRQRAVVWVAIVVGLDFFAYSPMDRLVAYGRTTWYGYVFLLDHDMSQKVVD